MESFKELRNFKPIRDAESELKFTHLLRHIYHRHRCKPFRFLPLTSIPRHYSTYSEGLRL